jgi:phosphoserine phosphatase RsbU/P
LTAEQLSSIYTQRGIVGLIAIGLLAAGYVTFIHVIRREVGQRARFETEVKIAQDIQTSLLPEPVLTTAWCEIAGVMIPAAEVGGDYFDVVQLSDSLIAIVVADVTGHGVGAGILSSMTKSALRLQLQHDPSPVKVFEYLNRTIFDLSNDKTFVTCAYALIDNDSKTVRLSTAGHPPVLYYQEQPNVVHQIRTASPGLGMRREGAFLEEQFQFKRNDGLLFYTDGATEAMDVKGTQFGMDRLEQETVSNFASAQALSGKLQSELTAFAGTTTLQDDVTLVCVKFS